MIKIDFLTHASIEADGFANNQLHTGMEAYQEGMKYLIDEIGGTMSNGMLWFDDSNTLLADKIQKASEYYVKKYGVKPNLCLVHPKMLEGVDVVLNTIEIRPYRPVLPGHIWIGFDEQDQKEK